ncbi:MAG: hypothetical protein J2P31_12275, partial [Blastocatellia bacterium]|nr:hypothetical protein [Blastocatellia bacterium]
SLTMQLNENSRFIFLTLGVFCSMLGAAVLLFSLIAWVFFAMRIVSLVIWLSAIAFVFGALLLLLSRMRQVRQNQAEDIAMNQYREP